jgi:hypothetical protein
MAVKSECSPSACIFNGSSRQPQPSPCDGMRSFPPLLAHACAVSPAQPWWPAAVGMPSHAEPCDDAACIALARCPPARPALVTNAVNYVQLAHMQFVHTCGTQHMARGMAAVSTAVARTLEPLIGRRPQSLRGSRRVGLGLPTSPHLFASELHTQSVPSILVHAACMFVM